MVSFPNAKINLGLHVVEKRPDGFHNIETIFYPVGLTDILEIIPSGNGNTELHITGLDIDCDPDKNLCMKAYRMLAADHPVPPVKMHLHKVIPSGSGLGGGSSDGAHTLILLNNLFGLELDEKQLCGYAEKLGSDCPFFILNRPVYACEKGDRFEPVRTDLKGCSVVIIIPPVRVETRWAYSAIKPHKPEHILKEVIRYDIDSWRDTLVNDFEGPVFEKYPRTGSIKKSLYKQGAIYASLSGSGSAVYGLFREPAPVLTGFEDCFVWISGTAFFRGSEK